DVGEEDGDLLALVEQTDRRRRRSSGRGRPARLGRFGEAGPAAAAEFGGDAGGKTATPALPRKRGAARLAEPVFARTIVPAGRTQHLSHLPAPRECKPDT